MTPIEKALAFARDWERRHPLLCTDPRFKRTVIALNDFDHSVQILHDAFAARFVVDTVAYHAIFIEHDLTRVYAADEWFVTVFAEAPMEQLD